MLEQSLAPVLHRLEQRIQPLNKTRIERQVNDLFKKAPPSEVKVDMAPTFAQVPAGERAERLYMYLNEYRRWLKETGQQARYLADDKPEDLSTARDLVTETNHFNSRLFARMQALWNDEETRKIFLEKHEEANIDFITFKESPVGASIGGLERSITASQIRHEELTRTLFLDSSLSSSDQMETVNELEDIAYALKNQRSELQDNLSLKGKEHTGDVCDMVAMHEYHKLQDMRRQLDEKGFVWFDSMVDCYQEALISLTNGRWPLFIGEAGTGKSALASATANVLTGERPTLVACTPRTNEGHLIARMAMAGDMTYEEYGAAMQAATGYKDSRPDASQASAHGRIVRLDELFKLGEDSPVFAFLKELAQLKPGDIYRKREILKGFKMLATTNPSGPRYGNPEPNPALIREFAPIEVDYPKMNNQDSELYEFMIASLMNKDGIIVGASREELTPCFERHDVDKILTDGRRVIGEWQRVMDLTDPRHGYVYRLAHAIRAVQDAFIYGNGHEVKGTPLRKQGNGTLSTNDQGELVTLSTSTISPGDIRDWLEKFATRRKEQHPMAQTVSLLEYLQEQLKLYIKQASPQDRAQLETIFNHFHLFDSAPTFSQATPLTPKEIGYLSPRVPRPVILEDVRQETTSQQVKEKRASAVYTDFDVRFSDGSAHRIQSSPLEVVYQSKTYQVRSGARFQLDGKTYTYRGFEGEKLVVEVEDGLCQYLDAGQVKDKGTFSEVVAESIFGKDFLGREAILKMQERCQAAGISISFEIPDISEALSRYTPQELEEIKANHRDSRDFMFTTRCQWVVYNGERVPVTLELLKKVFGAANPFGEGSIFWTDNGKNWWDKKDFSKEQLATIADFSSRGPIATSLGKKYADQVTQFENGETRRSCVEAVWDLILNYATNNERLFGSCWDWTSSSCDGDRMDVGDFGQSGLYVDDDHPEDSYPLLGTCPAKR
jgi:hypothetical protein